MKKVYGDDCLSRTRVYEWLKRFKEEEEGREDIKDVEYTSRPKTAVIEKNIKKIWDFIKNEPKSLLRYIKLELNISKIAIYTIFIEKLGL